MCEITDRMATEEATGYKFVLVHRGSGKIISPCTLIEYAVGKVQVLTADKVDGLPDVHAGFLDPVHFVSGCNSGCYCQTMVGRTGVFVERDAAETLLVRMMCNVRTNYEYDAKIARMRIRENYGLYVGKYDVTGNSNDEEKSNVLIGSEILEIEVLE